MTNLEFINKEIAITKSKYKQHLNFNQTAFAIKDEKRLQTLQQIKTVLEAWEVVKKCLCIDTDSWDEYSDSFDYIRFTVASIHPLLGFSRQEIESIKKALELANV